MYNVHCTMYVVQCTRYNISIDSVRGTIYQSRQTIYRVSHDYWYTHCTLYTVQCTMQTIHCILYSYRSYIYIYIVVFRYTGIVIPLACDLPISHCFSASLVICISIIDVMQHMYNVQCKLCTLYSVHSMFPHHYIVIRTSIQCSLYHV